MTDGAGNDNWRYTLFRRARVGDVVLHYDKRNGAAGIVGFSSISGPAYNHDITWAARGTYARAKGATPQARPGFRVPLGGFTALSSPVTLAQLRAERLGLAAVVDQLAAAPTYFPFELSSKRELRLLQGYAFKMPRQALELFPALHAALAAADQAEWGPVVAMDEAQAERPGRNAPWSRDELILALDLYLRHRDSPPDKTSPEVVALSTLLNKMGEALRRPRGSSFRNGNGVYMKLMNFRRFDPKFTANGQTGLRRGNHLEEVVWAEFADAPERLAAVAAAIRAAVDSGDQEPINTGGPGLDIEEAPEGAILTRAHQRRERDRRLVEACKRRALRDHGRLHCWACGFEFGKTYGASAAGIIDCHHTRPVHTLRPGDKTKVTDLTLLCSNCHRVIHSQRPWLTLDGLKAKLRQQNVMP